MAMMSKPMALHLPDSPNSYKFYVLEGIIQILLCFHSDYKWYGQSSSSKAFSKVMEIVFNRYIS